MTLIYEDLMNAAEKVQKYERYFLCLCPFHDDSKPSCMVFRDGWFRCLGCNRHGSWSSFWNKLKGQDVRIRPEVETNWRGPDLEGLDPHEVAYTAYDYMSEFPSLAWYLELRGLEGRIEPAMLGYWNGWYTVPMFDSERSYLNTVYRAAPHVQETQGMRYWYKGEPHLYVPDWKLVKDNKYLVITYGIFDALTLAELRIPAATPSNGQESFKYEWLDDLRRVTYFWPDQGEENAARHHARELGWRGNVIYADWPSYCKDINDLHVKGHDSYILSMCTGL